MRLRRYRHLALLVPLLFVYAVPAGAAAAASVQVSTNATSYNQSSTVVIQGTVTDAGAGVGGVQVALEAQGQQTHNIYWVGQVTTTASGNFTDSFILSTTGADTGMTIWAVSEGQTSQTSFTVNASSPSGGSGSGGGPGGGSGGGSGGGFGGGSPGGSGGGSPSGPPVPTGPLIGDTCSPTGSGTVLSTSITQTDVYLVTQDQCLSLLVPQGETPLGTGVTVTESTPTAGSTNLPPGAETAATPDFNLSFGSATLGSSLAGTIDFNPQTLGSLPSSRVGLFYRSAVGQPWRWYKDTVDAANGQVSAAISTPGDYLVAVNTTTFNDVPQGYFAQNAIDLLLGRDAISGFPDGGFHPNASVTRAQFAKMLVLALGLPLPSQATSAGFSDVPANAWYAPYVDAAVTAGLVKGVTATTFEPAANITRAQIAVMTARAMGSYQPANPASVTFTDQSQIPSWALSSVMQAARAGIIHGLQNGSFDPSGLATRGEAAEMIGNLVTVTGQ